MSASRIQLTLPWYTARFSARIASWAPRPGRNPYEHSRKSCSYTGATASRAIGRGATSSSATEPLRVLRRLISLSHPPVTGVENGIRGLRTADVATSHAGARSPPAGLVASIAGSRHRYARIRRCLIPSAFGLMTDAFRCPTKVRPSNPPSGSDSALGSKPKRPTRAKGNTRFWPRDPIKAVSGIPGTVQFTGRRWTGVLGNHCSTTAVSRFVLASGRPARPS